MAEEVKVVEKAEKAEKAAVVEVVEVVKKATAVRLATRRIVRPT